MVELDKFISVCGELLYSHPIAEPARIYLDNRLPENVQREFGFGFCPPQNQLDILFSFCDRNYLLDNHLLYREWVNGESGEVLACPLQQHNLILPYRDLYGKVIALVGRTLLNDEERVEKGIAKYKNTSFKKSRHLFGLHTAKEEILKKGYVYIVEGQFDAISAQSFGIKNVVALGSSNMSDEQIVLLIRYTRDIRMLLDNDEAGELGRKRVLDKYGKYATISNNYVPNGYKDVDDFLKEAKQINMGVEEVEQAMRI